MGFIDKMRNKFMMGRGRAKQDAGRAMNDPYLQAEGQGERNSRARAARSASRVEGRGQERARRVQVAPGLQNPAGSSHTGSCVRLRRPGDRLGSRRPEGGDRRRQARAAGGDRRAQGHDRRRVPEHRHDPVQDPARGGPVPHRPGPAGDVRAELPGQGRDHHRRPGRPHHPRGRPRDGRGAQPAVPQPGHDPDRDRQLHRPAHGGGRRRRRPQPPGQRGQHRDRHRHPARPGPPASSSTSAP